MTKRSLDTLRVLTPCPLAAEFQEPVSHCKVCGRDVFREALRTAVMVTVLAGAAQAGVRAAIEPPPLVEKLEAAMRSGPPLRTGGVIARNHEWH